MIKRQREVEKIEKAKQRKRRQAERNAARVTRETEREIAEFEAESESWTFESTEFSFESGRSEAWETHIRTESITAETDANAADRARQEFNSVSGYDLCTDSLSQNLIFTWLTFVIGT